jgi:CDP-paratose 2-epimerase
MIVEHPTQQPERRPVLITGGAGFIGCNIADALAARGQHVRIADNLSRSGAEEHAHWLKRRHGNCIEINTVDVRDTDAIKRAVLEVSAVLHLAGQVAVTTSLDRPTEDFEINARGTLNVLEAVRTSNPEAPVLFASTNKVYGRLLDQKSVRRQDARYVPKRDELTWGVAEDAPLDFHSPYGCSKGAADQYVTDYARVFGLRTAVLRMSCIYGPRQFGTEDQGWIAHFLLRVLRSEPIVIYGDGLQVRDALHVSDAVAAWIAVLDHIDDVSGRVFNLGGGTQNTVSLLELIELIAELRGVRPEMTFAPWRPGDQPWYVSRIRALSDALGWRPRVNLREGLRTLEAWLERRFGSITVTQPERMHA